MKDYSLCYVESFDNGIYQLFFTSDLKNQWGDDWNDTPASCNAEQPYTDKTNIIKVIIELEDNYGTIFGGNTYSVEALNKGVAAWIYTNYICIYGGDTLETILNKIKEANKKENQINIYFRQGDDINANIM